MFKSFPSHSPLVILEADNGANGIGGNQSDPTPPKPSKSDIDAAVNARIAELLGAKSVDNDPMAALTVAIKKQYALETEVARLKSESTQIPADVKAKADWVDELGGLDKARETVASGQSAAIEAAAARRDKAVRLSGFDPERFGALALAGEYEYEVKTEKVDGKDVEVGYARRTVNGTVEAKRVADIVSERAPALVDSLRVAAAPTKGRPFVKQGVDGVKGNVWDSIREQKAAKAETAIKPVAWTQQLGIAE